MMSRRVSRRRQRSSWYCVRYCDPGSSDRLVGEEAERYWMGAGRPFDATPRGEAESRLGGVDLYIGGNEHGDRYGGCLRSRHNYGDRVLGGCCRGNGHTFGAGNFGADG